MNIDKYIGNKIKNLRLKKNITQQEEAEYLGITSQTLSRYENGILKTNNDILFALADYFNVSIDDFFPTVNDKIGTELEKIICEVAKELNVSSEIVKSIFFNVGCNDSQEITKSNVLKHVTNWLNSNTYVNDNNIFYFKDEDTGLSVKIIPPDNENWDNLSKEEQEKYISQAMDSLYEAKKNIKNDK